MLRGLKRRLDRLWEAYQAEKARRERKRGLDVFYDAVHAEVTRAGFDPEAIPALREYAEARKPPPCLAIVIGSSGFGAGNFTLAVYLSTIVSWAGL